MTVSDDNFEFKITIYIALINDMIFFICLYRNQLIFIKNETQFHQVDNYCPFYIYVYIKNFRLLFKKKTRILFILQDW